MATAARLTAPPVKAARGSRSDRHRGARATNFVAEGIDKTPSATRRRAPSEMPARQYRHSRSPGDGLASLCLRCGTVIASAENEWLLLECERIHSCNAKPQP